MASLAQVQAVAANHSSNSSEGFDHPEQIAQLASAQQQFAERAESLEQPEVAMTEYNRYIHEHTKAQMERAAKVARAGSVSSQSTTLSNDSSSSSRENSISSLGS